MRSTFTILFYLKKGVQSDDKPIMGRITIDGESVQFSTKIKINPSKWSVTNNKAIGRNSEALEINSRLDAIKASIHQHYHTLLNRDGYITAERLKNAFLGREEIEKTLLSFFEQHNELYKLKIGKTTTETTFHRYELTKQRLAEFIKTKYAVSDIPMREVNRLFIEYFESFLRRKYNNDTNSTMKYIQRLKTVVLFARNTGYSFPDPFQGYKMRWKHTDRGYLSEEELSALISKKITVNRVEKIRDLFLFSCFTGLSYIDLKKLKAENILQGFDGKLWIYIHRQKTKIEAKIPLLDIPLAILKKYKGQANGKLLPVISNQRINTYLKEIADLCGIKQNLTFHLARHTFATLGISKGIPIETVSKMLGHSKITTTQIYARVVPTKISEDMERFSTKIDNITTAFQRSEKYQNHTQCPLAQDNKTDLGGEFEEEKISDDNLIVKSASLTSEEKSNNINHYLSNEEETIKTNQKRITNNIQNYLSEENLSPESAYNIEHKLFIIKLQEGLTYLCYKSGNTFYDIGMPSIHIIAGVDKFEIIEPDFSLQTKKYNYKGKEVYIMPKLYQNNWLAISLVDVNDPQKETYLTVNYRKKGITTGIPDYTYLDLKNEPEAANFLIENGLIKKEFCLSVRGSAECLIVCLDFALLYQYNPSAFINYCLNHSGIAIDIETNKGLSNTEKIERRYLPYENISSNINTYLDDQDPIVNQEAKGKSI